MIPGDDPGRSKMGPGSRASRDRRLRLHADRADDRGGRLGILVAVAHAELHFGLQRRANEGAVKSTMHTVQIALEDFGLLNDLSTRSSALATLPDGRTLAQVCPTGNYPVESVDTKCSRRSCCGTRAPRWATRASSRSTRHSRQLSGEGQRRGRRHARPGPDLGVLVFQWHNSCSTITDVGGQTYSEEERG